ncbi:MAG: CoA-binding protein [bacterium]
MEPEKICRILQQYRTVAVVGLSPKPDRDSHRVARFLKEQGFRVIPVNPGQKEILGEQCYAGLADIPESVEIVDVFRRSEAIPDVAEEAIRIGAKVFWMQLGIREEESARRLAGAGIEVVMDRCIKIEYIRCGLSGRSKE